jgi:uncharacterized protein (TIGR00297 family)
VTPDVRWVVGTLVACLVAWLAWRGGSLSGSGAAAAAVAGSIAVAAGWDWGLMLVAYFVASTLLSRFRAGTKEERTRGRLSKGGRRDAAQVLANGGVFVIAALGWIVMPHHGWLALGAAALAASTADTWATEIGTLSPWAPRSIISGRRVPPGTSGGVTLVGLAASAAGAAFLGTLAWALGWGRDAIMAALVGGVAGAFIDSVLGATLQDRRWCTDCEVATERRTHHCGRSTATVGGWRWVDNDVVNALSVLGGALAGALVGSLGS